MVSSLDFTPENPLGFFFVWSRDGFLYGFCWAARIALYKIDQQQQKPPPTTNKQTKDPLSTDMKYTSFETYPTVCRPRTGLNRWTKQKQKRTKLTELDATAEEENGKGGGVVHVNGTDMRSDKVACTSACRPVLKCPWIIVHINGTDMRSDKVACTSTCRPVLKCLRHILHVDGTDMRSGYGSLHIYL